MSPVTYIDSPTELLHPDRATFLILFSFLFSPDHNQQIQNLFLFIFSKPLVLVFFLFSFFSAEYKIIMFDKRSSYKNILTEQLLPSNTIDKSKEIKLTESTDEITETTHITKAILNWKTGVPHCKG